MYLISLISIPLGYCRLSQKYVLDLSDFLLVEILLLLLMLVMAKGIFELKLSKIQMALHQTKSVAKFYENVASKDSLKTSDSRTLYRTLRSVSKKSMSRISNASFSSDVDYKTAYRSLLASLAHQNVKTSASSGLQIENYTINSKGLDHSLKTVNFYEGFGPPAKTPPLEDIVAMDVTTAKEALELSAQGFTSSIKSDNLPTPSNTTYSLHESLVNSSDTTYSVLNVTEQPGPDPPTKTNTSKASKSVSQGLNPEKKGREKLSPPKRCPPKPHNKKASKSKSQDLRVNLLKT